MSFTGTAVNKSQSAIKNDDLLEFAESMNFGDIHIKTDPDTQLRAIIAIHNTNLGPALGGCRCVIYESGFAAIEDAMRLAQGMSYKAAISGLPQGGGKSVLVKPAVINDREAYFESFGQFVEQLDGRYITAVDSGTSVADMDIIARRTRHVVSTSSGVGGKGDPSPFTAHGVLLGLKAAVEHKLKRSDLDGVRVAIQGAGHVAYYLAKELHELGARLTICSNKDVDAHKLVDEFNGAVVAKEAIYDVNCDVFAPCALGGVINPETVNRLKATIIAGGANNQLSDTSLGKMLNKKGILYAPDYVVNAGGLIHVSVEDLKVIEQKVEDIFATTKQIFERAEKEQKDSSFVADEIAQEIIRKAG